MTAVPQPFAQAPTPTSALLMPVAETPPPLPPKDTSGTALLDSSIGARRSMTADPSTPPGLGAATTPTATLPPNANVHANTLAEPTLALPQSQSLLYPHQQQHHPNLTSRLSALFHAGPGQHAVPAMSSTTVPDSPGPVVPGVDGLDMVTFKDRNALKVLVVTWNMGDALPKGDLSVLLGDVPTYVADEYQADPSSGLPLLPIENVHPYHVIVFAAQECPTPSGVPRGLGAGLMKGKGVGLQWNDQAIKKEGVGAKEGFKEVLKDAKEGDKDEKKREGTGDEVTRPKPLRQDSEKDLRQNSKEGKVTGVLDSLKVKEGLKESLKQSLGTLDTLGLTDRKDDNGSPAPLSDRKKLERLRETYDMGSSSPIRMTSPLSDERLFSPATVEHRVPAGPKGWSAMLEEWLCAGPPRPATPETSPGSSDQTPAAPTSPSKQPKPLHKTSGGSKPIGIPIPMPPVAALVTPSPIHTMHARATPVARSFEPSSIATNSVFGTSVATDSSFGAPSAAPPGTSVMSSNGGFLAPPADFSHPGLTRSLSPRSITRSPSDQGLELPAPPKCIREPGAGPYVNVAKERLLGLYMSVFVHKGCENLVKGVDKDFVTTGLAGGRFGNKGGIGISLHLGEKRLLFINAHLAAHTDRNDARLANIAKIKGSLDLNCFLPAEDPRATMPDLTDRFDSSFWCGDLNFRVDITRQHADWLLKQNKYQEALAWDQLRKALEDPRHTPLPGFYEAPITFMPTFKYDVWKSVRATNRDMRRSIRRRKTVDRHERSSSEINQATLQGVPEGAECDLLEEQEYSGSDVGDVTHDHGAPPCMPGVSPEMGTNELPQHEMFPDAESVRSSVYLDDTPFSQDGGDELAPSGQSIRSTASASALRSPASTATVATTGTGLGTGRPKPSLKEKSRKLLNILRLGNGRPLPRSAPRTGTPADSARRTSTSSFRSFVLSEDGVSTVLSDDATPPVHPLDDPLGAVVGLGLGEGSPQGVTNVANGHAHFVPGADANGHTHVPGSHPHHLMPGAPNGSALGTSVKSEHSGGGHARRPSSSSVRLLSSPPRRHISLRRRSPSMRSNHTENEEADDFDDTKDNRVGVYDSSKKQRIPSWCDRVLFKSHIIPDDDVILDEDDEDDDDDSSRGNGRLYRLTHVFSNFGSTLRKRSMTWDESLPRPDLPPAPDTPPTAPPTSVLINPDSVPPTPVPNARATFVSESPDRIPNYGPLNNGGDSLSQSPPGPAASQFPNRSRSVTFDGPQPSTPQRTPIEGNNDVPSPLMRPRVGTSVSIDSAASRSPTAATGTSPSATSVLGLNRRVSSASRRGSVSSRRGSIGSRRKSADPAHPTAYMPQLTHARTTGHSLDDYHQHRFTDPNLHAVPTGPRAQGSGLFSKLLRNLPGKLASRVSLFHGSDAGHGADGGDLLAPRRHLAGEVRVLHYGTIDDAGMRQLEGRSDHRPAIFAAAVYV